MRNAVAQTLYELAKNDPRIVVIVADISPAGAMEQFRSEYPDRFINVGVAEQSMIGLAAGLAQRGFRPFCYTIATFALFRAYEFIRCDLAYQALPVTVVGMGAGLSYSTLGGTHQAIEDVAVAMACPGLGVLAPCDPSETVACIRWCATRSGGPVYMRIGKAGEPDLGSGVDSPWEHGRLNVLHRGADPFGTCVVGYGPILGSALRAAEGVGAWVFSACTLDPFPDREAEKVLGGFNRLVVVEEAAGAPLATRLRALLGGPRAPAITSLALPSDFVHFNGTREELLAHVGLGPLAIAGAVEGERSGSG